MHLFRHARNIAASAVLMGLVLQPAIAQEISDAHLKAARAAVAAIGATTQFDQILPIAAISLKDNLIQKNPDLQELIEKTVEEKIIAIAARRADLEKEAAMAYAKVFSEADLNTIAQFYSTPAGKKLIADGPIVTREVAKAADIWQRGIARDLAEQVGTAIAAAAGAGATADPAAATPGADPAAPVDPTAPAPTAPAQQN